jgi:hypothetical protein
MSSSLSSREEQLAYGLDYINNAVKNPKNRGKDFRDLSLNNQNVCKSFLYVIEYDDNPRDFSARPKVYGAYWSDHPDPVNKIAIDLWPAFGSPQFRDDEDNIDGSQTKSGQCYQGSACLGVGSRFLSLSVRRITSCGQLRRGFFKSALLQKVLSSRGVATDDGDEDDWIRRAEEARIIIGEVDDADVSSDTKLPPKKKQKGAGSNKTKFVFEAELEDGTKVRSVHATAKEAATAAWQFSGDHDLEVLGDEWYTDTGRYGEQSCYNVMITKEGDDWEAEDMFLGYMTKTARKREVVLLGHGNEMRIYKENANDDS